MTANTAMGAVQIYPSGNGYEVYLPGFDQHTQGDDILEAAYMAQVV